MLSQLLTPLQYLQIRHPTRMPQTVNWVVPLGASAVIVLGAWLCDLDLDVFSDNGLVARCLGFVQTLPGFYIAALAAIVTFGGPSMDQLMKGDPATLWIHTNQGKETICLTRRRFLAAMFAYLTASSFVLTFGSIALLTLAKPILPLLSASLVPVKAVVTFVFLAALAQLLSITFWGLYYLGDRIHRP